MITPPKFKGGGITVKVGDKVVTQPAAGFAKSISATNSLGASVNSIAIMVEEMKDSFAQYTFKNMELREEMLKQREDYIKDEKKRIKDAKRAAIRQAGLVRDRASEKLQEKKTDKEEDKNTIGAAKKALGFFEGVAALLKNIFKSLLIYTVLDWMSKPENRQKLIKIFTAVKGMIEAFVKIADFLVTFGLEGLVEFLENPLSFGGLFGLLKFITVLGAIFAPVALAKFGLAAGGAIMKLVTGGGLKKMLTGLFRGIGGMIKGLMAFVKGMGLGGMLALGAGALVVGTAIAAVNANQDGTAVIEDPDDPNKSQADEIRESGGMTGAPISADMLGFGEFARGGPLPQFAAGGWIHGPQSGYPVSLDGGRSTAFIGHGTEYVATKAAGGGVGKAFVVPFDTPATRGNPGLTNTRLAEASRSGFGLPMPFSKGGEIPQMFLGGMIDAGKNLLGLNKTMDPVLFGLAKKGVGMSVNMLGGNPDYWKKPESQRSIEDMAREVASKSQILKSGGQDKVHVVKEPTGKSTSGSGTDSKSTGPQKIDIAKVFQNLGGGDLMGSYMNDMGEAANKAKGGFVKGCTWCNKKRMAAGGLLDFIASGEGGYNSMNQGTRNGRIVGSTHNASEILGKNLTDMTVGEVMSQQSSGKLFAAGRYQIIPSTMKYIVKEMNIDKEAKYDKSLQDKLGVGLIKYKRPYAWQYIQKQHNDESGAMLELAREWASLPDPATGESVYGNGNKALHSVAEVKQALNSARGGAALVSDDPNLNLASAQTPGQGGTSPEGTAADGTVADAKPKKIDIMSAFNNLGGKDMLQSYFDDMTHEGSGSKISESALAEKEAAATKKQDSVQVGDLNPTPPPPVEPPPPVVAGGGSEYKNPAADFLVARMGWLSDLSTPPKNLI